jgi:hypothetical protein
MRAETASPSLAFPQTMKRLVDDLTGVEIKAGRAGDGHYRPSPFKWPSVISAEPSGQMIGV